MARRKAIPVLILALSLAIAVSTRPSSTILVPRAHAATVSLALIGNINAWNYTSPVPNPGITLNFGDTVVIKLSANDNYTHRFWFDSNNDSVAQCNPEPCSRDITKLGGPITFSFTANFTAGKYQYYCYFHPYSMGGNFTIKTVHDAAVSGLRTSRNFAYNSITANPIQVNVTAQNKGIVTDIFAVWAKANTTLIGNQTVTLGPGTSQVVTFTWHPELLTRGSYILTAYASKIMLDANLANNQYAGGTFTVKLRGDVDGDCKVDIVDLASVGSVFGKTVGGPGFNPAADLNNDGVINIVDLVLVAGSFGQVC